MVREEFVEHLDVVPARLPGQAGHHVVSYFEEAVFHEASGFDRLGEAVAAVGRFEDVVAQTLHAELDAGGAEAQHLVDVGLQAPIRFCLDAEGDASQVRGLVAPLLGDQRRLSFERGLFVLNVLRAFPVVEIARELEELFVVVDADGVVLIEETHAEIVERFERVGDEVFLVGGVEAGERAALDDEFDFVGAVAGGDVLLEAVECHEVRVVGVADAAHGARLAAGVGLRHVAEGAARAAGAVDALAVLAGDGGGHEGDGGDAADAADGFGEEFLRQGGCFVRRGAEEDLDVSGHCAHAQFCAEGELALCELVFGEPFLAHFLQDAGVEFSVGHRVFQPPAIFKYAQSSFHSRC